MSKLPNYSQLPDCPYNQWALPLWRCPPGQTKMAMSLSRGWLGFQTHFVDGRNFACPGPKNCQACRNGEESRWNGALVVGSRQGRNRHLAIFTPSAAPSFAAAVHEYQTLVGVLFQFRRRTMSFRSMLIVDYFEPIEYFGPVWTKADLEIQVNRIFRPDRLFISQEST